MAIISNGKENDHYMCRIVPLGTNGNLEIALETLRPRIRKHGSRRTWWTEIHGQPIPSILKHQVNIYINVSGSWLLRLEELKIGALLSIVWSGRIQGGWENKSFLLMLTPQLRVINCLLLHYWLKRIEITKLFIALGTASLKVHQKLKVNLREQTIRSNHNYTWGCLAGGERELPEVINNKLQRKTITKEIQRQH